jgi:parallel beta-helix repeat protein
LNTVSNVQLDKLDIYSNSTGVALYKSDYCKLTNNEITIAGNKGIWMDESNNNSIEDNIVTILPNSDDQTTECISLKNSHNNTIDSNRNSSKLDYIYYLNNSYNNKILYKNVGNIYCNGLFCKSCEINTECDMGEILNRRGNKWTRL